ncbi:MAG TPA: DUF5916 domain-containing protein [Pyrinomonadaceae bacterium]|jgi:hypothetical protein|nr:DUF5916 domain-containing protein [Pyrinomonadaceae bacterium]
MKRLVIAATVLLLSVIPSWAQPSALTSATPAAIEKKTAETHSSTSPDNSSSPVKPSAGKSSSVLPPEKAQPVKLVLFAKPPVIDGKLDEEVWQSAPQFKDFYQWRPSDSSPASARTEVMAGYDSRFIYFAFHAYDDVSKVRANVAKRDNIFDDDVVGLILDTFNDKRRSYELFFNPLGIQQDGFLTEGANDDFSVDIVMESKGMVTTDGFTVEVAIPFKSLRYEAGKDKLWGLHILRFVKHADGETDSWMPISKDQSGLLGQAGHITGLEGISTERTLELIPSLTLSETGKRKRPVTVAQIAQGGRFVNEPIKFDVGLTGKYSVTPQVTLDFAVNPDFAQVESDQLVVTANQRFPIFFDEKRPFFLEGIDIFRTQIAAVHTRTIVDPDYAAKLTGKIGRNTFGLLLASDNAPGNFSEDERPTVDSRFLDKNASVGILRLKRDVGKADSFIGFLGTYRRFVDTNNLVGGFDGRFRVDKLTTFSWQVLGTRSRQPFFFPEPGQVLDRKENGFIYAIDYNNDGRHFGHEFSMVGRTRYYQADVGFNRRNNTNNPNWFVRYNSEPKPQATLVSWRVYTDFSANFDWQGRSQNANDETQLQLRLKRETFIGVGTEKGYERVFESEFGAKRQPGSNCVNSRTCTFAGNDNERSTSNRGLYFYAESVPSKKYRFNVFANRRWGALDYDFGAGQKYPRVSPGALVTAAATAAHLCDQSPPPLPQIVLPAICFAPQDPGAGDFLHIDGGVTFQPTTALSATLNFTKERLKRYDTGLVAFDENIVSLRTTYQFSRFLFARGRIDFDSIASNVKGQFLFGYTPNPGTAFYAGYNDDLNRRGFNPFSGNLEPGFRRNGRTFFIKMSYLFRKSF